MVREQQSLLQKMTVESSRMHAPAAGGSSHQQAMEAMVTRARHGELIAGLWATAYIPTAPPALKLSLQAALAALPAQKTLADVQRSGPQISAIEARVVTLSEALLYHEHASDGDRRLAEDARSRARASVANDPAKKLFRFALLSLAGLAALVVVIVVIPALLKSREDVCRDNIGHYGSQWDASLGAKGMAACIEECDEGKQWACELVAQAKGNAPASSRAAASASPEAGKDDKPKSQDPLPISLVGEWKFASPDEEHKKHRITLSAIGMTASGMPYCNERVAFESLQCAGLSCTWSAVEKKASDGESKAARGSISFDGNVLTVQTVGAHSSCHDESLTGMFVRSGSNPVQADKEASAPAKSDGQQPTHPQQPSPTAPAKAEAAPSTPPQAAPTSQPTPAAAPSSSKCVCPPGDIMCVIKCKTKK